MFEGNVFFPLPLSCTVWESLGGRAQLRQMQFDTTGEVDSSSRTKEVRTIVLDDKVFTNRDVVCIRRIFFKKITPVLNSNYKL